MERSLDPKDVPPAARVNIRHGSGTEGSYAIFISWGLAAGNDVLPDTGGNKHSANSTPHERETVC